MNADASTRVADLERTVEELRGMLASREGAYDERAAHQVAANNVLKAISTSPGNAQPALDLIARRAMELCNANAVGVYSYDGALIDLLVGHDRIASAEEIRAFRSQFPIVPAHHTTMGRAILERRIDHLRGHAGEPEPSALMRAMGLKSFLHLPLIRDGKVIGCIGMNALEPGGFSDTQVELLKTFAEQAVIAITSAETWHALQTRTANLREALEQQTATAEVLGVINASPGDLAPVFEAILEKAHALCGADIGALTRYDGEFMRAVAVRGLSAENAALIKEPFRPSPGGGIQRLIDGARFSQMADMATEHVPGQSETFATRTGLRTYLGIPLRKDGVFIGQISAYRREVRPFAEKDIALLENFAAQAVIAMENARLLSELRARTGELAERNTAFAERIEHQSATIDVLKAMSASPGDPQPVFDLIAQRARDICGGYGVSVFEYDGALMHLRAFTGVSENPTVRADYEARFPAPPSRDVASGRSILEGRTVQMDLDVGLVARSGRGDGTVKSGVGVPMLRATTVIGALGMGSQETGGFSDTQIELLKTFAEQAVIAVTSAETYRALQTRTTDLQESLEYQTAISDVLKVISRSTFDLQPVLDTIMETAARICDADMAFIFRRHGDVYKLESNWGFPPAFAAYLKTQALAPGRASITQRTALEGRIIHVHDMAADPEYALPKWEMAGVRTGLGVPLTRDGVMVGVIDLARRGVRPFSERQIELVATFADQAVIAIENTRLLTEQREALDQQTATAEILRVINASPGDLTPVFDTILAKAHALCGAELGSLGVFDGQFFRKVARYGYEGVADEFLSKPYPPLPIHAPFFKGETVHIADVQDPALLDPRAGLGVDYFRSSRLRVWLEVPLWKDGTLLGTISGWRREPRPFSEKEIRLLQSFADQAVIAMENARLLTEQREALERQTAMADLLAVINASPGDPQPVFDAILQKAHDLCDAESGALTLCDEQNMWCIATLGLPEEFAARLRQPFASTFIRAWNEGMRYLHIPDLRAVDWPEENWVNRGLVRYTNARTRLIVPMRKDGRLIGLVSANRPDVRAFVEQEISLLESFAAQAVIAMDNARLLTEQREALERQTATAEVLQVINASPGNLGPVFDAILEKATLLCGTAFGFLATWDGQVRQVVAARGLPPAMKEYAATQAASTPSPAILHVFETKQPLHVLDLMEDEGYRIGHPDSRAIVHLGGVRTALHIPLVKDDAAIGNFSLFRREVRAFSGKEIALLENFAAQAVIAMENARLLTEQREALERQTATAEVLQTINANPGNLAPVFDAMLEKAALLCDAQCGSFFMIDGDAAQAVVTRGLPAEYHAEIARKEAVGPMSGVARVARGEDVVHLPDMRLGPSYLAGEPFTVRTVDVFGLRTWLGVPLRKDGVALGLLAVARFEVRPFTDRQIDLLKSFAAQAVIAMENARLLREQREALERQTATAEVLGVINENPGNLAPVFDSILEKALTLSEAAFGTLWTFDTESAAGRIAATRNIPPALAEFRAEHPPSGPSPLLAQLLDQRRTIHQLDIRDDESYRSGHASPRSVVELGGARTLLLVPLLKDRNILGTFQIYRKEVRAFTDRQISLVEDFAAQAVIAMENARLLGELREALERQTATAEVVGIINANPGDLEPVFDAMLERALRLCGAAFGILHRYDGEFFQVVASRGVPPAFEAFRRQHPFAISAETPPGRAILTGRSTQVPDVSTDPFFVARPELQDAQLNLGGIRAVLNVPLIKDGQPVGMFVVYRKEPGTFPDKQVALLESFGAQAVIAMENARLLREQREALEQQTATAEVLQVINASPGNLPPVFDAILEKAMRLCGVAFGLLREYDGEELRLLASRGVPAPFAEFLETRASWRPLGHMEDALISGKPRQRLDIRDDPHYQEGSPGIRAIADLGGARTLLHVPMVKDGGSVGLFTFFRNEVRAFFDKEIALLENFAAQAVIAMENARLLREQREALEQQTAMAEVLAAINASPGNLRPVFDAILEKATLLCGAAFGFLATWDGQVRQVVASRGFPPAVTEFAATSAGWTPSPGVLRVFETRRPVHILDLMDDEGYRIGHPNSRAIVHLGGVRTSLHIPLVKDDAAIGYFTLYRREVQAFTGREVALLENFAAQAVIAMDNARLLNEIRQRQRELDITFENMGDGVAMFDGEQKLAAWNRNFQDILGLPDDAVRIGLPFADYIRGLAERGEYGADANADEQIGRMTALLDQANRFERTRPNGRVIDIRQNPIPGGGFVVIYADITERKRAEEALRAARDDAEAALRDLKVAQASLVQAEKMASLGQLTAGIAHEIKNPLNFVNNFAALSVELLDELKEVTAPALATLDDDVRADADDLTGTLTSNLRKIEEHGKRADNIVRGMLEHSRASTGERRAVDLNELVEEALNLAYHGARARDQSFNITLERDYGADIAPIAVAPQDLTRVFLNLFGNGFDAARARRKTAPAGFEPALKVTTRDRSDSVEIRVRDNGTGVPPEIRDKLFQPFFTTKPTGEGTGLGLSISYDIVTQQHGGSIVLDSEPNAFTEFTVTIPRGMASGQGGTP